ncbi:FtsX-like permease family protein [Streptomyces sp. NPDC048258]|uniref:FtsX-like permease family protein n=1 Tax=Streptomyces sp. NPDC048258 TaxID=3365527 RepID=UPI0037235E58
MSRRNVPTARLLGLGMVASRRGEAGRTRFVAVYAATLVLAVALVALVTALITYAGQRERGLDRGPVFAEYVDTGVPGKALWAVKGDRLPGGRPYPTVFLTPLAPDAPLPPGLAAWPSPGEAVLSPALLAQPEDFDITRRYGTVVGTIGDEGLQSPDELFAYVVPPKPLTAGDTVRPILGFGPTTGPVYFAVGQTDYDKPLWLFVGMITGLLVVPAATLLVVAVRTGSHHRDRRIALITALGGTPRHRALVTFGEALIPVTAGALTATAVAVAASLTDVTLPWTGHVLVASDLRAHWWAWAAAVLAAVTVTVTVLLVTNRDKPVDRPRDGGTRLRPAPRSVRRWAMSFPLMLLLAVRGPDLFEPGTTPYVLTNWVGVAGCVATLPAAVAMATMAIGRALAATARRRGMPGALVAGRRMATHPGPIARMTSGVAVAIVVVMQVAAWQGQVGEPARAAQATADRIGSSALVVTPRAADPGTVTGFFEALPATMVHLGAERNPEDQSLTLVGTCTSLTVVHIECPKTKTLLTERPTDPRIQALVGTARLYVETADPRSRTGGDTATSLLLSRDGSDLSEPQVARLAHQAFPQGAEVGTIGAQWLAGAMVNKLQGDWLTLFGMLGIGCLAVAALLSGLAEFLRQGRALAPLTVLAGNRSTHWVIGAFALFLPLLIAGIAGSVVGVWIALPQTTGGQGLIPDQTVLACGAAALTVALIGWIWGTMTAMNQAGAWKPRDE